MIIYNEDLFIELSSGSAGYLAEILIEGAQLTESINKTLTERHSATFSSKFRASIKIKSLHIAAQHGQKPIRCDI